VLNDLTKKTKQALSGDFVAYDLFTGEKVWHVKNAERAFFMGRPLEEVPNDQELDGRNLKKDIEFKEITEMLQTPFQEKVNAGIISAPEMIVILNLKVEEIELEADPDANKVKANPKKENRLYYRFYFFDEFLKGHDYTTAGKLIWEHSDTTTLQPDTDKEINKDSQEGASLLKNRPEPTIMKEKVEQGVLNKFNNFA